MNHCVIHRRETEIHFVCGSCGTQSQWECSFSNMLTGAFAGNWPVCSSIRERVLCGNPMAQDARITATAKEISGETE